MPPVKGPHPHPLKRIDAPPTDYSTYSTCRLFLGGRGAATRFILCRPPHTQTLARTPPPPPPPLAAIMPTCDVCGEDNIGVAFHCSQCSYDECEACHAAFTKPLRESPAAPTATSTAIATARVAPPRSLAGDATPTVGAASKPGSTACLPLLLITIGTLAVLTVADLVGLVRITESIYRHEPHRLEEGSIAGSAAAARPPEAPYYEATPDRVWQTSGLKPGTSRRASESGREVVGGSFDRHSTHPLRSRAQSSTSSPTRPRSGSVRRRTSHQNRRRAESTRLGPRLAAYRGRLSRVQGVSGPDGYYVQHLYWSLKHAEENFLPTAGHPDVLILYAEDVDGPAVARAASKLTKSAVVAQLINFKRTAPGYENATTAFTTCWEGNDWVRSASKEVCVAGLYPCRAPPPPLNQSVNFLNMNYGGEAPLPSSRLVTCDPCRPLPCILAAFIHTMWSLPVFKK